MQEGVQRGWAGAGGGSERVGRCRRGFREGGGPERMGAGGGSERVGAGGGRIG